MRLNYRLAGLLLLFPVLATACRRAVPADDAVPVQIAAAERRGDLPPEQLYGATAVENLRVLSVELEVRGIPRGWDGMRIAVVSDLQLGLWPDNVNVAETAVRRAVQLDPDLVVLLGDYVGVGDDDRPLERVLAPLRGRPALAVLGARDLRSDTLAMRIANRLEQQGISLLRNRVVALERGGDTAYIAGIEPPWAPFTAAQQAELLEALPEGAVTPILLSHLPTVLPQLPERRFPVVLAGNTLCSEVEVPGVPRLATLSGETLAAARVPRTNRLYRSAGNTLFVTCGLGYSFVPARFGLPPEIALVTLLRIPEPRPEPADTPAPIPAP
jgi:uncharacterized protein